MAESGGRHRTKASERRRSPRIEILGQLDGHMMTVDAPVTILDLSLGGFGVESAAALDAGDIHDCRFTLRDGVSVILPAKVVHCRPKKGPKGSVRYLAGLEFLPQATPDAEAARVQLIDRIAATLPKSARKP